ncbi:MAG: enoyl-CoA hydratase/isomerase family protein [Alphaproteobacteria bacterium]|jgi:enoyl-CoA hydratase|nr:enoyl-CoA hydratase/isomerase family protein [Alphaproteobacteria bacterium]
MSEYANILVEAETELATITLDRPAQLNPLDWQTVAELKAAVAEIEAQPAIRLVIVTGAGRAFSAGGDLKGYLDLYQEPDEFRDFLEDFFELLRAIEDSAKVYIAAINGVTVAGGLELLLACDQVIAAEGARIGDGHLNFAQLPGAGGSQRLPRAIGSSRAKALIFSGELLSAAEAERIGLVNRVVPDDALMAEARALAERLLAHSPTALRGAKHLVNEGLKGALAAGLALEMDYVHNYATTEPDAMEGLRAFDERRKPNYKRGG